MSEYKSWDSFKFKGKKFLALYRHDGNVGIKGDFLANYGSYLSIESFKEMYAKQGESLNLSIGACSIVGFARD